MSDFSRRAKQGDSLWRERQQVFDKSACTNGPDEHGEWPCDPQVSFGGEDAECSVCGRVAAWKSEGRHV